jgi:cell division protein FtsB
MVMLQQLLPYLKNKYVIVLLLFIVWISFFDRHNLVSQFRQKQKLQEIEQHREYYQEQITNDTRALDELMSDEKNLEKFAREKYRMKKDDEDIFVIVKSEE